jgi:hypothetical protein
MSSRKRLSSAEYKKIRENFINKQAGRFTNFLLKQPMNNLIIILIMIVH